MTAQADPTTETELDRLRQRVRDLEQERRHLVAVVEMLDAITGSFEVPDIVQSVVHKLGEMYGLDRCSVFLAERGNRTARLMATYEDPSLSNHLVDLERYPEIRQALETNSPVIIADVGSDTLVSGVRGALVDRGIRAISVVPISWRGVAVGAIFLRTFRDGPAFSDADLRFVKVVATLTAKALRTAWRIEKLQKRGGTSTPGGSERDRQRATLVAYLQRLLQEYSEHETGGAERLAPAQQGELERLVGLSLAVVSREARPQA
jgi:GAF domain-containing protein